MGWDVVLRPDRRPQGIIVSDLDVTIEKGLATLTGLETVANGATLLCTQTFERDDTDGAWIMTGHTTIPYGADVVAKVVFSMRRERLHRFACEVCRVERAL